MGAAHAQEPPPLGWAQVENADPRVAMHLGAPRPFGQVVGDRVRHRITITVTEGAHLRRGSVPMRRRIEDWLELQQVTVAADEGEDRSRYALTLSYQLFATPLGVTTYQIPGFTLYFAADGQSFPVSVPSWAYSQSPLLEMRVAHEGDNIIHMRPDTLPAPVATGGFKLAMAAAAVVGSAAAGTLLWLLFVRLAGVRRPFAETRTELRRLRAKPLDAERLQAGFRALHRGLDATAGQAVFSADLPAFCRAHPRFAGEQERLAAFFDESRSLFFGAAGFDEPHAGWERLEALARRCRVAERRAP